MRFKGRLGSSRAVAKRKWNLYWKELDRLGFGVDDPIYRFFAGEVFHDGEMRLDNINLATGSISIILRNVHAVGEVCSYMKRHDKTHPRLRRSDFRTSVTFCDAKLMQIRGRYETLAKEVYYEEAELSRDGDYVRIDIAFCNGFATGVVRVVFGSVQIEDIGERIRKYVGDEEDVAQYVTWVCEDPAYYVTEHWSADTVEGL